MKSLTHSTIILAILLLANQINSQRRVITEDLFSDEIFELLSKDEISIYSVSHFLLKIGDHRNALRFSSGSNPLGFDSIKIDDKNYFKNFTAFNAVEKIAEISEDHQVLMINEHHGNAQHRVFTKNLLGKLYQNGYRYLFLEGLSTQKGIPREYQDTTLQVRKYPLDIPQSGTYPTEPQFSNMIRHALEIGYRVLPYDDGRGKNRENVAVTNIGHTLKKNPTSKAIIHCGFGHLYEREFMNGSWLGKKIKDSLGIDPLTIDQVILTEKPSSLESPFYNMMQFDEPTIFIDPKGKLYNGFRDMEHFDLVVYQPRTKYKYNRPNWLFEQNGFQLIEIKTELKEFPLLIKAIKSTDDPKAVPIDTIERKTNYDPIYLALPKGEFTVHLISKTGILETQTIVVN